MTHILNKCQQCAHLEHGSRCYGYQRQQLYLSNDAENFPVSLQIELQSYPCLLRQTCQYDVYGNQEKTAICVVFKIPSTILTVTDTKPVHTITVHHHYKDEYI